MTLRLNETSTLEDVLQFLEESNLEALINEFKENQVDGEDFFNLEMSDLTTIIPVLKLRKKFILAWSTVTGLTFDCNGARVPLKVNNNITNSLEPKTLFTPTSRRSPKKSSRSLVMPLDSPHQRQMSENVEPSVHTPSVRSSPRKRSSMTSLANSKRSCIVTTASPCQKSTSPNLFVANKQKKTTCSPIFKDIGATNTPNNNWIHSFSIPSRWEPSVEAGLKKGQLTNDEKSAMTRQLCTIILSHTDSASQAERDHVAISLIKKYPFLSGSFGSGHQYWSKKIKERLLNLRRKVSRCERKKFQDQGKLVPKGKPGRKRRNQQQEQHYFSIPAIPEGETEETLENMHKELKRVCKSGNADRTKLNQLMDATFPRRRRDVLTRNIRVWDLLKQYPPLQEKKGSGLKAELVRILGQQFNLTDIKQNITVNMPLLLKVVKHSCHKEVRNISTLLQDHDSNDQSEVDSRCVMAALPHLLGEKKSLDYIPGQMFWKVILDEEEVQRAIEETTAPRLISTGTVLDVDSLCLASEGMVVCNFKPSNAIVNAVLSLMACYYVLNINYPKGHGKNVFVFFDYLLFGFQTSSLPIGVENLILSLKE